MFLFQDDILIVVGDKEEVEIHKISTEQKLLSFAAHKNRIKDAVCIRERNMLLTASNDGFIKLWQLSEVSKFHDHYCSSLGTFTLISFCSQDFTSADLLKSIDTSCRITCLALYMKKED